MQILAATISIVFFVAIVNGIIKYVILSKVLRNQSSNWMLSWPISQCLLISIIQLDAVLTNKSMFINIIKHVAWL